MDERAKTERGRGIRAYNTMKDRHMGVEHKDAVRIVAAIQDGTVSLQGDPERALEVAWHLYEVINDMKRTAGDIRAIGSAEDSVLSCPEFESVGESYRRWVDFMKVNVTFFRGRDGIHGMPHCARVLLLALAMGNELGLSHDELEALSAAAVFHDCYRMNDLYDKEHGLRGAEQYRAFCSHSALSYDERVFAIIACHNTDDTPGRETCRKISEGCETLYLIFKDADGLDRIRLGLDYLNTDMLRLPIAHRYLPLAERLLAESRLPVS